MARKDSAITRRGLADEIDRLDGLISELQMGKREAYEAYRAHLEGDGVAKSAIKTEVEAVKLAIRQRRELAKDEDVVIERGALVDEILLEIRGLNGAGTEDATRAPRASEPDDGIPPFLRRTPTRQNESPASPMPDAADSSLSNPPKPPTRETNSTGNAADQAALRPVNREPPGGASHLQEANHQ